jgi:molybdopterin converting factor small subunit
MRNAEIKTVITAIKQKYSIYARDIATTIGLSPNYFSTICSGRNPLTDTTRDLLLRNFPLCAELIEALPVDKESQAPYGKQPAVNAQNTLKDATTLTAVVAELTREHQRFLERMMDYQNRLTDQHDHFIAQQNKVLQQQDTVLSQQDRLLGQHGDLLKTHDQLLLRFAEKMDAQDALIVQTQSFMSSVAETLKQQTTLMNRLSECVLGSAPTGQGEQNDAQQERKE